MVNYWYMMSMLILIRVIFVLLRKYVMKKDNLSKNTIIDNKRVYHILLFFNAKNDKIINEKWHLVLFSSKNKICDLNCPKGKKSRLSQAIWGQFFWGLGQFLVDSCHFEKW